MSVRDLATPRSYLPLAEKGQAGSDVAEEIQAEEPLQHRRSTRSLALLATALLVTTFVAAMAIRLTETHGHEQQSSGQEVELVETECRTVKSNEACHFDVLYIKDKFLKKHPDWYRGLSQSASFKDIQAYLSRQKDGDGKPRCPYPCDYEPTTTSGPRTSCHTARGGEDCYNQVMYTSRRINKDAAEYGGLNKDSSFTDIQAYLHEQTPDVCPLPCGRTELDAKKAIAADEKGCKTAVKGDACFGAIKWVRTVGIKKHPDWFAGITANSTPEEVQNILATKNGSHCSHPACHCHTALPGEDCYTHMSFTIKAIPEHPRWYPGLTTESSLKEVQAFMHEERDGDGKRVCPMPCGLDHDGEDSHHQHCHTAIAGETCHDQILWAMSEVKAHPEWYPGLNGTSSKEDFQALLHFGKKDSLGRRCPIPCNEESMKNAIEHKDALNCHTAQEGEPCHEDVLKVRTNLKKDPHKYHGLTVSSTFEEIQTRIFNVSGSHCDHLPCDCHTAHEGEHCYTSVSWALSKGIHRFSALSKTSTREEAQQILHNIKKYRCLLPCAPLWKD
eukprot:CAMPEP_0171103974 /NCGR_PEP_ID=MMETSP0766_2-20121228/59764_1 /TAXON_ID=439317 /ORGANISM="Gambierdiscus australes, Strain CAWD 149" /LENGTH=557 /DNA_ID=CAMNT_0011564507 /DNA_START=113 /DNA_END=1786 /DNA_ORIENTATION=-